MKRILERSNIDQETGCWNWTGPIKGFGYGYLTTGSRTDGTRKTETAHRYSYRRAKGEIGSGLWVLHKCDNPLCVNPDHLYLGNRKQNVQDMIDRGRMASAKGRNNNNSKLTDELVISMRKDRTYLKLSYRSLGKKYGLLSHKTVQQICDGRLWPHLPLPEPPQD